jgi:hypothetical protein
MKCTRKSAVFSGKFKHTQTQTSAGTLPASSSSAAPAAVLVTVSAETTGAWPVAESWVIEPGFERRRFRRGDGGGRAGNRDDGRTGEAPGGDTQDTQRGCSVRRASLSQNGMRMLERGADCDALTLRSQSRDGAVVSSSLRRRRRRRRHQGSADGGADSGSSRGSRGDHRRREPAACAKALHNRKPAASDNSGPLYGCHPRPGGNAGRSGTKNRGGGDDAAHNNCACSCADTDGAPQPGKHDGAACLSTQKLAGNVVTTCLFALPAPT